jgi:hypothetical protein
MNVRAELRQADVNSRLDSTSAFQKRSIIPILYL